MRASTSLKGFLLVALALPLLSCASASYVLHSRPAPKVFSGSREKSPIASADGVALLAPREPYVIYERQLDDGTVWVNHSVVLKNASGKPVSFKAEDVRLETAEGGRLAAVFAKQDRAKGDFGKIAPGSLYLVTTRYLLPAQWVSAYADSSKPMQLAVTLSSGATLRQEVWLWEE